MLSTLHCPKGKGHLHELYNTGHHVITAIDKADGFPGGSGGKESACNAGDQGSIPGSRRSSRGGHHNPLQYSFLENPLDRGAWQATVHGSQRVRHN